MTHDEPDDAHETVDDALRERLALHAQGALAPDDAAAVARHLARCPACAAEAASYAATLAAALAVPVAPPALRERLRGAARAEPPAEPPAPPPDPFAFVAAGEGTWEPVCPGVHRKQLGGEPSPSYLIRIDAGAHVVTHVHRRTEHCLVVSGDFRVAGRTLEAGDYHRAQAGSTHEAVGSVGGCLVLVVEVQA